MSKLNEWPDWPSERAWIGIGIFALTVMLLWMVKEDPSLRNDEFFKAIATLVIGTGFVNGVVSWAYSATQGGTELAHRNATLVEKQADLPKRVVVDQPDDEPVPVEEIKK